MKNFIRLVFGIYLIIVGAFLPLMSSASPSSSDPDNTVADTSSHSASLTPLSVLFNWRHQYEYGGFYAAKMLGLYRQAGLEVKLYDWQDEDIVQSVLSGRFDIGVDSSMIIADYLHGKPIRLLFASLQYSPLVLLSHQPIDSLSELANKKIMLVHNYEVYSLLHQASVKPIESRNSARLEDFIQGKTDLYSAYETNEPFQLKKRGVPFYMVDPKDYGVEAFGDLVFTRASLTQTEPEALMAFKQATIQGWHYALNHPHEVVDYILSHYPVHKDRDSFLQEAMAIKKYVQPFSEAKIGEVSHFKLLKIAEDMRKMQMVSSNAQLRFPLENLTFQWSKGLQLTKEERQYLVAHPVLKLGNDRDWAPFEYIDDQGRYQGMVADFMKLIARKLQVSFEPNRELDWQAVLQATYHGQRDFLTAATRTPERLQHLNFTQSYLDFPMVLAGREVLDYVPSLRQLSGQTVAVTKGYASEDYLRRHFPEIKVLTVENVQAGLHQVLEGKAVGYLGNLAAINYAMREDHLTGLKIVANTGTNFQLAIGVPKDNPVLLSILQKTLNQITSKEREQILHHWLPLKMVSEVDKSRLWKLLTIALLIIVPLGLGVLYLLYLRKQQKQALDKIHELTHAAIFDAETLAVLEASESYAQMVGLPKEEIIGRSLLSFQKPLLPQEKIEEIIKQLKSGQAWKGGFQVENPDGHKRWVMVHYIPQKDLFGRIKTFYSTRRDITVEKENERLSQEDGLTGLLNRRNFNERFPEELKRAQRENLPLTFMMMDIDFFKRLNDEYGHQQGDRALRKVAKVLKDTFSRANDFVFRLGGEEFGVITYEAPDQLKSHLQSLQHQIQQAAISNIHGCGQGLLTLSMGAVIVPPSGQWTVDALYRMADDALYQAKEQGRDQFVVVDLRDCTASDEK